LIRLVVGLIVGRQYNLLEPFLGSIAQHDQRRLNVCRSIINPWQSMAVNIYPTVHYARYDRLPM
jgi:hypothetical protein